MSWMMTLLQEIHAKSSATSDTDQHFITNRFHAVGTSSTKKFLVFVDQLKSQWIMEDLTTSSETIVKLDKMHKNMVADGTWINTNKKDTKIIALALSFQEICKHVSKMAKFVTFSGDNKGGGDSKKGGGGKTNSTNGGGKSTKTCCPEWQVTKKGSTITNGKKYTWCPHHHSKDGSINGLYMPAPYNHKAWAKAKAEQVEKYKRGKQDKEGRKRRNADAHSNKKAETSNQLKLALSNKLTQALVT